MSPLTPAAHPDAPGVSRGRGRSALAHQRSTWHRKVSAPVLWWMVALLVVAVVHRWVPQSRWLLVHMVTLGLITNSIVIWSQHFAEALLKNRRDDDFRRGQLLRSAILNAGIVITIVGLLLAIWPVTLAGATAVSVAVTWHAAALAGQVRRSLAPRFAATVRFYVVAAALLPVGAGYGVALAAGLPDPWHERVLLAHETVNILGFVGLTVIGTLITLWPTMLRTRLADGADRTGYRALAAMLAALLVLQAGALGGSGVIAGLGTAGYLAALLGACVPLVRAARGRRPDTFATFSAAAGVLWLIGTLAVLAGMAFAGAVDVASLGRLTVPFVAGFLVQVLLGAMSHLMPTVMGGGPRAVKAGLAEMDRAAAFRVVLVNAALIVFLLPVGSWMRVISSLLVLLGLASFLPLMMRSVTAQVAERRAARAAQERAAGTGAAPGSAGERIELSLGPAPHRAGNGEKRAPRGADRPAPRRHLRGAVAGLAVLLLAVSGAVAIDSGALSTRTSPATGDGLSAARAVAPTGETTVVRIDAVEMAFSPARIEVPIGDQLVLDVTNTDPTNVHDLRLANGADSGRLAPGESARVEAGVITGVLEGWCSIIGHRSLGMTLEIVPVDEHGAAVAAPGSSGGSGVSGDPGDGTASVPGGHPVDADAVAPALDLQAPPSEDHETRSAVLEPAPAATVHRVTLDIAELPQEIAPGVDLQSWTFDGRFMGPTIRARTGDTIEVTLINNGTMGHSVDFHAGTVSPDEVMRTIPPGESLVYRFTAERSGIWLYHCSTMPMSSHLAAGMFGAVIVDPPALPAVDREYLLVQSEAYVDASDAIGQVDPQAIAAEDPTVVMWNGHATQYLHEPLEARVGERVRIWVLAAGPSKGLSFHVVGSQFDTVFHEGAYRLRPDTAEGGGAQTLGLATAQGGFVELVFEEPGTYTFVNHSLVDMERGARGLITVTA